MTALQMLTATAGAELLKLRKRPAWWIITAILLAAVILFGYLLTYAFLAGGDDVPGMDSDAIRDSLLPAHVVPTALGQLAGFGGPLMLVLAAILTGSEYGWSTWKTLTTQQPARTTLVVGKLAVLLAAVGALVAATMIMSFLASLLIALIEGEAVTLPSAGEIIGGFGAGWLILTVWSTFGVLLAVLFRGVGLAVGLGLVYYFVVETALLSLPLPEWFSEGAANVLLTANAITLSGAFGQAAMGVGMTGDEASSPTQAALVLVFYAVVFAAAARWLITKRPID